MCLNDCYLDYYRRLECRPSTLGLGVIAVTDDGYDPDISVCSDDKSEANDTYLDMYCSTQCPDPCFDQLLLLYETKLDSMDQYMTSSNVIKLRYAEPHKQLIKHIPKTTLFGLIIALTNLLNFWHGLSILELIMLPFQLIKNQVIKITGMPKVSISEQLMKFKFIRITKVN